MWVSECNCHRKKKKEMCWNRKLCCPYTKYILHRSYSDDSRIFNKSFTMTSHHFVEPLVLAGLQLTLPVGCKGRVDAPSPVFLSCLHGMIPQSLRISKTRAPSFHKIGPLFNLRANPVMLHVNIVKYTGTLLL